MFPSFYKHIIKIYFTVVHRQRTALCHYPISIDLRELFVPAQDYIIIKTRV